MNNTTQLKGGNLIEMMGIDDPHVAFYAQCGKHKEYWERIHINYFDVMNANEATALLLETAQEVINRCPQCENERPLTKTRFPEGAEL